MQRFTLLTASVVAIGGLTFVPSALAQDRQDDPTVGQRIDRAADRAGDAMRRVGEGTAQAPDAEGIRDVIAQVAEAAVTKDGLDDLVERLVDADRNRLGEGDALKRDLDHLNGIIAQFQENWQARYNQEFDIDDEDAVFHEGFAQIMQGEIGEGARVAGERRPGEEPGVAAPGPESDRIAGGDTNREPGRNIATVVVQESHGLPQLTVPMIQEFPDSWKIDLPENISAEQLRKNLEDALTRLNQHKDQWPADVQEGYRHATHTILAAVMGQTEGFQGGMQDGMQRPGEHGQPGQPGQPGHTGERSPMDQPAQPGQTGGDMPR